VLDEPYLLTAARYVELNPVRAGLIEFLATLEQNLGRILRRQKPGPKRTLPSRRTRERRPAS